MQVEVLNISGKKTAKKVDLADGIFGVEPSDHSIYLDVKHYLAAQRQGTHKSKQRNEISGSTRKLHKQKGTGGSRKGSIKSPMFKGGGRVFGPKPRNYSFKLNKKVKELPQTEKIKPVLLSLQAGSSDNEEKVADVPVEPVEKADEAIINRLKKAGVIVIPVAQNSNYLSVNFVAVTSGIDSLLPLLQQLSKQLVWLKLDHAAINDASMDILSKLTTLTRLQLSNATITDKGLLKLQSLQQLQSLNLTGTKVTAQGVVQLKGLKKLKHLYLYQTAVGSADWVLLHRSFPNAQLDSGKYTVPPLASDTTLVTAPKK